MIVLGELCVSWVYGVLIEKGGKFFQTSSRPADNPSAFRCVVVPETEIIPLGDCLCA